MVCACFAIPFVKILQSLVVLISRLSQIQRLLCKLLRSTKSDFETGKGCVFNEQNLPVSKTHSLVIKPQEVNFKWSQNGNRPAKSRLILLVRGHTQQLGGFVLVRWGYGFYFTVKIDCQVYNHFISSVSLLKKIHKLPHFFPKLTQAKMQGGTIFHRRPHTAHFENLMQRRKC